MLDSLRFGFWAMNDAFSGTDPASGARLATITPANTLVIASSISNGGGASLRAAEQDREGLIDAVVVAEPNAQPASMDGVQVRFGGEAAPVAGRPLVDYFTYRMLYEPCAAIAAYAQAPNGTRPGWLGFGTLSGVTGAIAKVLFAIFIILFLLALLAVVGVFHMA